MPIGSRDLSPQKLRLRMLPNFDFRKTEHGAYEASARMLFPRFFCFSQYLTHFGRTTKHVILSHVSRSGPSLNFAN